MRKVFIVTEANQQVATGHLMECIVCARVLIDKGMEVSFWINNDADSVLKKRIPCLFKEYIMSIQQNYGEFFEEINKVESGVVIFNLREIKEVFLEKLNRYKNDGIKVICIDEFGHRNLKADVIINPMKDEYYWEYKGSDARLYSGAKYLVLPQILNEYHKKEKHIEKCIKNIVITMGGVDPKDYTTCLLQIMPEIFPEAKIQVILGGGNLNKERIVSMVENIDNAFVRINVNDLLGRMYNADLVICAGGNTLHEVACIGTPAIVIPSMPHEIQTAKSFERDGFSYVIDIEKDMIEELRIATEIMKRYAYRKSMSERGKSICDGLGYERIANIVAEMDSINQY